MDEYNYAIRFSRLILTSVGAWPNFDRSFVYMIVTNTIFTIFATTNATTIVLAQTIQIFLVNGDLDMIVDIICTCIVTMSVSLIKMISLRKDEEVLKLLLNQISEDWTKPHTFDENITMRDCAKTGNRLSIICFVLSLSLTNVFFLVRIIMQQKKEQDTGKRVLLYESYFPMDTTVSPCFEIIWVLQVSSAFWGAMGYSGSDCLFVVLMIHLRGQIIILRDRLNDLTLMDGKNNIRDEIVKIVQRHMELNRFAENIELIFSRMFLAQVIGSVVLICLQGYSIITFIVDESMELPLLQLLFMIVFVCYTSLHVFIICYVSEKLRGQSEKISSAAYNCQWYQANPKDIRGLLMIMSRSQHPLEITAGKFATLSLNLFLKIGKTSMGYLSVLLAMKERS